MRNPAAFLRKWKYHLPLTLFNKKSFWQVVLAGLMIVFCIYFIQNERVELVRIGALLGNVQPDYFVLGLLLTAVYLGLQGWMYVCSFQTIHQSIPLTTATVLFLKRNFVSVFLPAGAFSSLTFFTKELSPYKLSKTQIHLASFLFALCSLLSVIFVAIPALAYSLVQDQLGQGEAYAFAFLVGLTLVLSLAGYSLIRQGWLYRQLVQRKPELVITLDELRAQRFSLRKFVQTNLISVGIEFVGIAHLYVAMLALGFPASLPAAIIGYIVMVLLLIASPLLRGLGAIEVSMTYVLNRYGLPLGAAAAVTLLFRFFEFWLPLLAGMLTFVVRKDNLLLRVLPVMITFFMGVVNIISTITPSIPARVRLVRDFLPPDVISVSNFLVLVFGVILIILSIYLLRGSRNAWWMATALALLSLVGNLTKAFDYEEASVGFVAFVTLLYTRRQYAFRGNLRYTYIGLNTLAVSFVGVLVYGIVGFYLLNRPHFGTEFSWTEAIRSLLRVYFLLDDSHLTPLTSFGRGFLYSIYLTGIGTLVFAAYIFLKPFVQKPVHTEEEHAQALELVKKYGKSPLDYFKTYFDKSIYLNERTEAFVAYRVARNYGVVLEDPVCENEEALRTAIREFDAFCLRNGLRSVYYRVSAESLPVYLSLKKKKLLIGQEAIVDLANFNLEGKDMKSVRNALRKVEKDGFASRIYEPPLKEGLLQKLATVSNEWLKINERQEIIFSQGMFDEDYLSETTVLTVENAEEKVVAFANIIPDYAPGEATYDLIRKTADAPNGSLDFLMVSMFQYLAAAGYARINLGLVPLSGMEQAENMTERTLHFAYQNLRQFAYYQGLREYKDKFKPCWTNKYLVFDNHLDLLQLPVVLSRISKV